MFYVVRLSKSGGSLVMNVPAPVREAMHLAHGDQVAVKVERGRIVIVKLDATRSDEIFSDKKRRPS